MNRTFNSSATPLHSLKQAIEGLHIAMLTTTDADGRFSSKPMYLLEHDAQGQFWFFTQSPTDNLDPSEPYRRANLAFSAEGSSRYVSVSCVGEIVHDRQRIEELWSPMAKPWFPEGTDSPDLACLRFVPVRAELWEGPGHGASKALVMAASVVSGKPIALGEHHVLNSLAQPNLSRDRAAAA